MSRWILFGILIVVILAPVFVPCEYWQQLSWIRHRVYEGEFEGKPLDVVPPSIGRPAVPLSYRIQMTSGVCRITRIDRDGNRIFHSWVQSGYVGRNYIAADERLQFDPGPNTGHYRVETGLKFHLLSPYLWRLFSYSILASLSFVGIVSLFLNTQTKDRLRSLNPHFTSSQWTTLAILVVLSCTVLYPSVHELGHALVGTALGGQVEKIVFTPFTGETPHVRFAKQPPQEALPWKAAGGPLLPVVTGCGLLILWLALRHRLSPFREALLLVPTLALLFPIPSPELRRLALKLGCTNTRSVLLVEFMPVWLGLAAYGFVARMIWRQSQRTNVGGSSDQDSVAPPVGKPRSN
jgi:hypothetical protein